MTYPKIKHLCIYHANCADGFGAALAVKKHWDVMGVPEEDREFLAAQYGDEAPDVKNKNVTIVDFSYPRKTLIDMYNQADSILVIDHHKTAQEELEDLDFCIFDMSQSGAMLTWDHYHGPFPAPKLIQYIQDRDLWQWKMRESKEASAGLSLIPMTFENWEPLLISSDEFHVKTIVPGRAIHAYQEAQVEKIAKSNIPLISLCSETVPCINTTTLISEIGNELSKRYPFAVMYFDTDKDRCYSLRSQDDGTDVSEIAKKFGGGGHPNAAGFSIPLSSMLVNTFSDKHENIEPICIEVHDTSGLSANESLGLEPNEEYSIKSETTVELKQKFYSRPEYEG